MTAHEDSNLISLFNEAVRADNKESRDALIAHWKLLCEALDGIGVSEETSPGGSGA